MAPRVLALAILIAITFFKAYPQITIKNLVFEGAGMRGIAYAGAVSALEEHGVLTSVEKVGGTSAGAIVSLAIALGYSSSEIEKIVSDARFQKFNDAGFGFPAGTIRLFRHFGWYKGDKLLKWVEELIANKTGNKDITLKELQWFGYKQLYLTAVSLNEQRLIVLSDQSYPNMRVADAVRISVSIPFYFRPVKVDKHGQVVHTNDFDHVLVDGGITANYPIFIFDLDSGGIRVPDKNTLGIRIDNDEQIIHDQSDRKLAPFRINGFADYVSAFYTFSLESLNRWQMNDADWQRTVSVSCGRIGPKVKRMSADQKTELIENGKKAVDLYIKRKVN